MANESLKEEGMKTLRDIDNLIESCKETIQKCRNPKSLQIRKLNRQFGRIFGEVFLL